MAADNGKLPDLDIPVSFGGVSIGKTTGRIGIKVARERMKLTRADDTFCDRRLTGRVVLGHEDDAAGQKPMFDDQDHQVAGSFDVKGFRCDLEAYTTGLTFKLAEVNIEEMAHLSNGAGRLIVDEVGEIPEDEKLATPDEAATPGTLKAEGPWRDEPLDNLFDPGKTVRKALHAAGIDTVGQLADYSASEKRLTDVAGIGPGKAQAIEDRLLEFWQDNPHAEDHNEIDPGEDLDEDFD